MIVEFHPFILVYIKKVELRAFILHGPGPTRDTSHDWVTRLARSLSEAGSRSNVVIQSRTTRKPKPKVRRVLSVHRCRTGRACGPG